MKRKSLLMTMALSIVLALALLLSACGGASISDTPKDNVLKLYKPNNINLPAYELSDLSVNGTINSNCSEGLFYATNEALATGTITYTVYDFATLSAIFSIDDTATDDYSSISIKLYDDFFVVVCKDKLTSEFTTNLMNKEGANIATAEGEVYPKDFIAGDIYADSVNLYDLAGLFTFDGDLYSCREGVITLVKKEMSVPSQIPVSYLYTNEYYWVDFGERYVAFDKDLNEVAEYKLPSYAEDSLVEIMKNGNLFVQYSVPVDQESTEYDYIDDDTKYNLYQYVYSIKNNELKEIDFGGYISYVVPIEENKADMPYGDYTYNVDQNDVALAIAYRIENKRINENESIVCVINKDNVITKTYSNPSNFSIRHLLSNDRFLVMNYNKGMYQIVDSKLKVYGEFKSSAFNYYDFNGAFIIVDGDLYNHDFKLIYEANEESEITLGVNMAYVTENVPDSEYYSVYVINAGDTAKGDVFFTYSETNNVQFVLSDLFMCVRTITNASTTYSYYVNGKAVISDSATTYSYVAANQDVIIVSTVVDGETVYKAIK